ncbi:MAG: hypothetical protein ACOYOB_15825 [Myxococcota bacterium]
MPTPTARRRELLERIEVYRDRLGQLWVQVTTRCASGRPRTARKQLPDKAKLPEQLREARALRQQVRARPVRERKPDEREPLPDVATVQAVLREALEAARLAAVKEREEHPQGSAGSMWAGALGRVEMSVSMTSDMRWLYRMRKAVEGVSGVRFDFDRYHHKHTLDFYPGPETQTQEITPRYVAYQAAAEVLRVRLGLNPYVSTVET